MKDACEWDTAHHGGLELFRLVFLLLGTYAVVEIEDKLLLEDTDFSTNSTKTGLFDPVCVTNRILEAALPALWAGMVQHNLPANFKDEVSALRAAQAQAQKQAQDDKAKAAAKGTKAADAGAKPTTPAHGAAGGSDDGAGGDGEQPASRPKRKAAALAAKKMSEMNVPDESFFNARLPASDSKKKKTGHSGAVVVALPAAAAPPAKVPITLAALQAENETLKAHNKALEAQLTAAGLVPVAAAPAPAACWPPCTALRSSCSLKDRHIASPPFCAHTDEQEQAIRARGPDMKL